MQHIIQSLGGKVGIYAVHLGTGKSFSSNSDERFPMASTDKIPLIAYCLCLVDQQQLHLETQVPIHNYDLRTGTGLLSKRFDCPGVTLTIKNLIRLALEISDNTAFDILLKLAGGANAVKKWLKSIGLSDIELSRSCLKAFADQVGITVLPADEKCTVEQFQLLEKAVDINFRKIAEEKFLDDTQDTTTPLAMGKLLEKIITQEILSKPSTDFMLDCMRRCQTGQTRIPGLLPPEVIVAHKTGTIASVTNDVGIIECPHHQSTIIMAIYINSTSATAIEKERGIAEIARSLYHDFTTYKSPSSAQS